MRLQFQCREEKDSFEEATPPLAQPKNAYNKQKKQKIYFTSIP
jgi:hypothetical protein